MSHGVLCVNCGHDEESHLGKLADEIESKPEKYTELTKCAQDTGFVAGKQKAPVEGLYMCNICKGYPPPLDSFDEGELMRQCPECGNINWVLSGQTYI